MQSRDLLAIMRGENEYQPELCHSFLLFAELGLLTCVEPRRLRPQMSRLGSDWHRGIWGNWELTSP